MNKTLAKEREKECKKLTNEVNLLSAQLQSIPPITTVASYTAHPTEEIGAVMKDSFTPIVRPEIIGKEEDTISDALKWILESPNTRSHCITLCQSSGSGKTRGCIELLKEYCGIYLLCENIRNGFSSNIASLLEAVSTAAATLSEGKDAAVEAVWISFIR